MKMFFYFSCDIFFGWDSEKNFKVEKLEVIEYFDKKRSPSEEHFYKNGKVQNMPVVAGRLVLISVRCHANLVG